MTNRLDCDLAILGGGLSGSLIALAFAAKRPDVRVRLIECGAAIGGNHIWSFFDGDVAAQDRWLVDPLVTIAGNRGMRSVFLAIIAASTRPITA